MSENDAEKESGLLNKLKAQGMQKAMSLMSHPKSQEYMVKAFELFEKSKNALNNSRDKLLSFYGLATRQDLKNLSKKMTTLKKDAEEIKRVLGEFPEKGVGNNTQPNKTQTKSQSLKN